MCPPDGRMAGAADPLVRLRPVLSDRLLAIAAQPFQRGQMLWSGNTPEGRFVYVLYTGGTYARYVDTYGG